MERQKEKKKDIEKNESNLIAKKAINKSPLRYYMPTVAHNRGKRKSIGFIIKR